jgi:hypothetical protein
MKEAINTQVAISEIMGAISLRVLWAATKRGLGVLAINLMLIGIGLSAESYFQWSHEWQPQWMVPFCIVVLWIYLMDTTGNTTLHRAQWYFPRTNAFTSLILSAYIVMSVWALWSLEKGLAWSTLFFALYGIPLFIHYLLKCGYYIVMMRRYPRYRHESYAVTMPSVLRKLSMKEGGITGVGNGEADWYDNFDVDDDY